jgi:hypothetical protein
MFPDISFTNTLLAIYFVILCIATAVCLMLDALTAETFSAFGFAVMKVVYRWIMSLLLCRVDKCSKALILIALSLIPLLIICCDIIPTETFIILRIWVYYIM